MPRQLTIGFRSFTATIALGILAFITACTMSTAFSADAPAPAPHSRSLIIIGASYAKDWGQPDLPGYRVSNKGVGGEESSAVRVRFERDVIAPRPDAVLIWGHINDIFRAPRDQMEPVKQRARDNYKAMHEQARAASIEVILATEVTMTVGDTWKDRIMGLIGKIRGREDYRAMINRHVKDVNAWLRNYAAQHGLKLVDLERAVDSGNGSRRAEYSQADGSHISPAGYQALTAYASKALAAGR
jgi:lysophospholipase L1-like esterase